MNIAKNKIYQALEGTGRLINPSKELSNAILFDTYAQRYSPEFACKLLGVDAEEFSMSLFANLQGILLGEGKKAQMDAMRAKSRR